MHLKEEIMHAESQERNGYTREILIEVCEEHRVGALHDGYEDC